MKKPLDAWTEGYLSFLLDVQKKCPGTIKDVRCTMRRVLGFFAQRHPGKPLWKISLTQFIQWVEHEREQKQTVATLLKELSHIRGLLSYAWRSGRCDQNVLDGFHLQDAPDETLEPTYLELDEVRALIEACPRKTGNERRERLIILLFYGCGFRTGELQALDVGDVDLERQEIFVRFGKGQRERRIPVPNGVWTELLIHLAECRGKKGPLIRTPDKRRRLNPHLICAIVRNAGVRAGLVKPVLPKTLRHTFATHLMDRGVDIAVISSLMGHRSPQETGVYLHVLEGKKENAVARLPIKRRSET
jgi:integrase/recombinase XerD